MMNLAICYNIIFIPLQFAYRIPFSFLPFGFMELCTLILYFLDLVLKIHSYKRMVKINRIVTPLDITSQEKKLIEDKEKFNKKILTLKIEIICSAIACFPFSFIFDMTKNYNPILVIDFFCCLRLVKIWPIFKVFDLLKKR